ncbi:hypothetical protein NDU88_002747 [Pleurodeles waltl]|uniref:Uncharacterized protein n=1 Tax=Pleurodeles waltl TaxID=8319 RepID=A0AAV7TLI8_PLEWA|nr:hypothetical protein NDU88_002747 [Pleurodeles waltl]
MHCMGSSTPPTIQTTDLQPPERPVSPCPSKLLSGVRGRPVPAAVPGASREPTWIGGESRLPVPDSDRTRPRVSRCPPAPMATNCVPNSLHSTSAGQSAGTHLGYRCAPQSLAVCGTGAYHNGRPALRRCPAPRTSYAGRFPQKKPQSIGAPGSGSSGSVAPWFPQAGLFPGSAFPCVALFRLRRARLMAAPSPQHHTRAPRQEHLIRQVGKTFPEHTRCWRPARDTHFLHQGLQLLTSRQ